MSQRAAFTFAVAWQQSDSGAGADPLLVTSFSGVEEIGRPYRFEISLISRAAPAQFAAILRRAVKLGVRHRVAAGTGLGQATATRYFHGRVQTFEMRGFDGTNYQYRARMVPRLAIALSAVQSRVFVDQTLFSILETTWGRLAGMVPEVDRTRVTADGNPSRPFTMQYKESGLQFAHRLLEFNGVSYYFRQEEDHEVAVFTNAKEGFGRVQAGRGENTLEYVPATGAGQHDREAIRSVFTRDSLMPGQLTMADFNETDPLHPFRETRDIADPGTGESIEIDNDMTGLDAATLLDARVDEYQSLGLRLFGESTCRNLSPGYAFKIQKNPVDEADREYLAVRVVHRGTQSVDISTGNASNADYCNHYEAIPNLHTYRPQRTTPRPFVAGVLHGVVEGDEGANYPQLDEHGRYRVRLFFDNDSARAEASCWVRKAESWGGPKRGMHLPLPVGAEVLVGFSQGDPDQPIILASAAKPVDGDDSSSPVVSSNPDQAIFKSRATRIVMQDLETEESITLAADGTFAGVSLGPLTSASLSIGNTTKSLSTISTMSTMSIDKALMTKVTFGGIGISMNSFMAVGMLVGHAAVQGAIVALLAAMEYGWKHDTDKKRSGAPRPDYAPILFPLVNIASTLIVVMIQKKLISRSIVASTNAKLAAGAGFLQLAMVREARFLRSSTGLAANVSKVTTFLKTLLLSRSFQSAVQAMKNPDNLPANDMHGTRLLRSATGCTFDVERKGGSILIATDGGSIDLVAKEAVAGHGESIFFTAEKDVGLCSAPEAPGKLPGGSLTLTNTAARLLGPEVGRTTGVHLSKTAATIGYGVWGTSTGDKPCFVRVQKKDIQIRAPGALMLTVDGHNHGIMMGGNGVLVTSLTGNVTLSTKFGMVSLSSRGVTVMDKQGKGIRLVATGPIQVHSAGKLALNGAQVELAGSSVDIKAPSVKINGTAISALGGSPPAPPVVVPMPPLPAPAEAPILAPPTNEAADVLETTTTTTVAAAVALWNQRAREE